MDQSIRYSNGNSSYSLGIKTKQGQTNWPTGTYTVTLTSPDANLDGHNNVYQITLVSNDNNNVKGNRSTNLAPTVVNDSATTNEDTATTITVLANDLDLDSDTLEISAVTQGANGAVTINQGSPDTVTYTPALDFNGSDSFTYTVSDGTNTTTGTVTITVAAVNDAPVASAQSVTTTADTAKTITLVGTDVDNDDGTLVYTVVGSPSNGTLNTNSGSTIVYTPDTNWTGTDTFTFKVNDGSLDSVTVTVTITVSPA